MLHLDDAELVAWTAERRARLELDGAAAFAQVTRDLRALGINQTFVELSQEAVAEERRHSESYRALASWYAQREIAPAPPSTVKLPAFAEAPAELRPALRVVGMCAINETMASGFLDLCLRGARVESVRQAIREVLGDEIRHGRIGWMFLASLPPSERAVFSPWLQPLAQTQLAAWRRHIAELPPRALPEHGCPSREAIEAAAVESLRDLVLQGFEQVGIECSSLRRWIDAGCPTS